jgi:hypothetical protein
LKTVFQRDCGDSKIHQTNSKSHRPQSFESEDNRFRERQDRESTPGWQKPINKQQMGQSKLLGVGRSIHRRQEALHLFL